MREIESAELSEWMAFYEFEPFGQDWLREGTSAAAICRGLGMKKVKPRDFLPVQAPQRQQTEEEQQAIFYALAANQKAAKQHGNHR